MTNDSERLNILQRIEDGEITAAEGIRLLNELAASAGEADSASEASAAPIPPTFDPGQYAKAATPDPEIEKWRQWWMIPMWVGVVLIISGGLLMNTAIQSSGVGLWLVCASVPFVLGVIVAALAWGNRKSRWIHIRVKTGQKEWPRNLALSFPIPTQWLAWFIRQFGPQIQALKNTAVDEVIVALDQATSPEAPFFVEVNEGEDGEQVQIYFG